MVATDWPKKWHAWGKVDGMEEYHQITNYIITRSDYARDAGRALAIEVDSLAASALRNSFSYNDTYNFGAFVETIEGGPMGEV
jgi:hypothetical protein